MIWGHLNTYVVADSESIKKRKAAAKRILRDIEFYKVCVGCESVILKEDIFCPVCDAYRFNEDQEYTRRVVEELSKREQASILPNDFI